MWGGKRKYCEDSGGGRKRKKKKEMGTTRGGAPGDGTEAVGGGRLLVLLAAFSHSQRGTAQWGKVKSVSLVGGKGAWKGKPDDGRKKLRRKGQVSFAGL